MTAPVARATLEAFAAARSAGNAIVVAGVGSGITALGAARGGAHALAVYNTAVYRIKGLPTALAFLPYDDCNAITMEAAPDVLAAAGATPVIVGLGAHDPRRDPAQLVDAVERLGAAGVTNEPFIGMYDATLSTSLEDAGLGFARERLLVRTAVDRGLVGLGWVFNAEEASRMVDAGALVIGAMVKEVTAAPGSVGIGHDLAAALEPSVRVLRPIVERVHHDNPAAFVLIHGGPLADPASVAAALELTGADGYVTGSTGERHPVERAVAEAIRSFTALRTHPAAPNDASST
jgi:predicted TIM-barrel enzyme